MTLIPDMAQTLAVVCLFADGPSTIRGIRTLRVKETDRIAAVAAELRNIGATVEACDDYWIIEPPAKPTPERPVRTYNDHRMAMAFAVAGLRIDGLVIDEPGCVAKTFPDFWLKWSHAFYAR
jgi:3-phosphoshikimate 1-carboxyvinyltransferase